MSSLRAKYGRAQTRIQSLAKQASKATNVIIADAETAGTAFGLAVLEGRYGPGKGLGPLPWDMVIGLGGHVLGFWVGGEYEEHLHNIARGAVTKGAVIKGIYVGNAWRQKLIKDGGGVQGREID